MTVLQADVIRAGWWFLTVCACLCCAGTGKYKADPGVGNCTECAAGEAGKAGGHTGCL